MITTKKTSYTSNPFAELQAGNNSSKAQFCNNHGINSGRGVFVGEEGDATPLGEGPLVEEGGGRHGAGGAREIAPSRPRPPKIGKLPR